MINRAAVLLRYKEPAVRWINEVDPMGDGSELSLAEANNDRNVFLVSDRGADDGAVEDWVEENWPVLFDIELEGWDDNEKQWPTPRTREMFRSWFEVEIHTMIHDTVDGPIYEQDD